MGVRERISDALKANAFGQAVTVLSQLALTPLYLSRWGLALYGEWLMLAAIPAYLAMADVGIGSAAGNEMAMRAGAGDQPGAQRTYRGALLIAAAAALLTLGVVGCAALLVVRFELLVFTAIAPGEAAALLLVLALYVSIGFFSSVVTNGFRAGERNALGLMLTNGGRLAEVVFTAIALTLGADPPQLAIVLCATSAATLAIKHVALRRTCPWLFEPRLGADRGLLRRLIRPALAFAALPAGNAVLLQGPILVIAAALGGPAVALFSTTRTLARLPSQLTNMINASIWPEISLAFGAGNLALLRNLHRHALAATTFLNCALALALVAFGPWLFRLWLGDTLTYDAQLLLLLTVGCLVSSIWNASSIVLAATNQHTGFAALYLGLGVLAVAAGAGLVPLYGLSGMCVALIVFEWCLAAYVLGRARVVSEDNWPGLLAGVRHLPGQVFTFVRARLP